MKNMLYSFVKILFIRKTNFYKNVNKVYKTEQNTRAKIFVVVDD